MTPAASRGFLFLKNELKKNMKKVVNAEGRTTWVNTQGLISAEIFAQKENTSKYWLRLNYGDKLGTTLLGYFTSQEEAERALLNITNNQ
jgi:aminoglycoside phosphotransferase